jgi:acyl-CoA thioester hydrolase
VILHRTHIRVRYADTDQMQIVYNGKYLEYFEVGRTELLRACGLPYATFEREGFRLPLTEAFCRYHAPARYDDMLIIESRVEDFVSPRLRIEYRIVREIDGILLVSGHTAHAFIRIDTGRPVRPPEHFVRILSEFRDLPLDDASGR